MPKGYEKMRNAFIREGMSEKAAKGKAARIWNAKHPGNPVTRKHKSKMHIPYGSTHEVVYIDPGANDRVVAPEQPICYPPFKSETHEGNGPSDSPDYKE